MSIELNHSFSFFLSVVDIPTLFLRQVCRQLFRRLVDTNNETDLGQAIQGGAFRVILGLLLDQMGIPANNNLTSRLYDSMSIRQGSDRNFNNLYDNDRVFRDLIQSLQTLVQKNGGPFTGMVTPDNTPGRSGDGGGNGGNAGGGAPAVAG